MHTTPSTDSSLDQATAARLARLRTMPVDVSALQRRLADHLPPRRSSMVLSLRSRWMRAVAALLLVVLSVAAMMIFWDGQPAFASPAELARFHNDLVSGKAESLKASSIPEANRLLATLADHSPQLPEVPASHAMACCMKKVDRKSVACVLLRTDGCAMTLMVADAAGMETPRGEHVTRDGVTWSVHHEGPLTMVSGQRQGRWICLIAPLTTDQLIERASALQY